MWAWLLRDVIEGTCKTECNSTVATMVNRCVAAGCSNTPSKKVSLFKFPKDAGLRKKWGKQVQRTRAQWKATDHSFVCSEHFTDDSFEIDSALASQFGLKKRRRLKPESVPTMITPNRSRNWS